RATHPQIWFQAIGAQQAAVREILRSECDRDRAEQQGKFLAAEFAGQDRSLHNQQRGSQGRNEANAAERIPQNGATDVNQERNERRLIDVSPCEVVAAGHVIKFVAKIAVAIVEIKMQQ